MACTILKRSLEFDPVHSHGRPSKRRRCAPMCVSPSSSQKPQNPTAFEEVNDKLTPGEFHFLLNKFSLKCIYIYIYISFISVLKFSRMRRSFFGSQTFLRVQRLLIKGEGQ